MNIKVQRRMSMLEWRTTTTDAEVTNGRQLHKDDHYLTKEEQRTKNDEIILSKHFLKTSKAVNVKVKDKDEDVLQPR